jgi:hypothetical protein
MSTRGIKARASYLDAAETWTTELVNNVVNIITNASGCMSAGDLYGEENRMKPVLSMGKEQKGGKGKRREGNK